MTKILDLHNDLITNALEISGKDILKKNKLADGANSLGVPVINQTDIPRMKSGGVDVVCLASSPLQIHKKEIVVSKTPAKDTLRYFTTGAAWLRTYSKYLYALDSKSSFSKSTGSKIGVILTLEGAEAFQEGLEFVDIFYNLGLRMVGFCWNYDNNFCHGAHNTNKKSGLTEAGKKLVSLLNKKGITIDVAHMNKRSMLDTLSCSTKPVICSHTNVLSLNPTFMHPQRLLDDEQIKAIAKSNGVIGISAVAPFLDTTRTKSNYQAFLNQVTYVSSLAGIDHIAIGGDFDGMISYPVTRGMDDISCYAKLNKLLFEQGFKLSEIQKIFRDNALRVFKNTWI